MGAKHSTNNKEKILDSALNGTCYKVGLRVQISENISYYIDSEEGKTSIIKVVKMKENKPSMYHVNVDTWTLSDFSCENGRNDRNLKQLKEALLMISSAIENNVE